MTYVINSYSGTPIASIPDKTINTTATSLRLPGRNYPNYGEPVVENMVWMLENFAGAPTSGPSNPRIGQLWYDVANAQLKVYDGTTWKSAAPVQTTPITPPPTPPGPTPPGPPEPPGPPNPVDGELLYDQTKKQLFVRGANLWNLVGPVGAADGNDANSPSIPGYTSVDALIVTDTLAATHKVLRLTVGGQLVAVVSNDQTFSPAVTPTSPLQGFTNIFPGITLNPSITNIKFNGESTSTQEAQNASFLGNVAAGNYMRKDQTNLPTNDNLYNLGSASNKYNSVYATNLFGTATSAIDSQTVAGINPSIFMRKDSTNVPTVDATHDLGSSSSSWFSTFSTKYVAGQPSEGGGPWKYIFKGDLRTGFGSPAPLMLGFYIDGTETGRFINRSFRLGDVTQDAGTGANPSIQPAFANVIMNQANLDGLTIRATVLGAVSQTNTMINLWANYAFDPIMQKAVSFRIYSAGFNAVEVGDISYSRDGVFYNTLSDHRRKTNVAPITNALDTINLLQAKTYSWIGGDPSKKVTGFLAHEVQEVIPNAVTGEKDQTNEKGEPVYQTMDHSKLVPILWAAVQELTDKVKSLEAKLA